MGWKVQYQGKDGKPAESGVFGNEMQAHYFAKTVKKSRLVEVATVAPSVEVTKCPDAETVNEWRAEVSAGQMAEAMAEAYTEAGSQARLYGASSSEALDTARAAGERAREELLVEYICGNCGKRPARKGLTTCYACARRA